MTIQARHSAHSTILVIERDPLMLTAMSAMFDMQGYKAILARTEEVALQAIAAGPIDLIVLSIDKLQEGCEFAARLRSAESTSDISIVFLTPELSPAWTGQLQSHGGVSCMLKPVDPAELAELVEKALWMPHVAMRRANPPQSHLHKVSDWVRLEEPAN